jgi:FkbM family methyltransferase
VDVGSNVGSYTILASAAGADVVAFEPGERFPDLERNVAINRASARCRREAVGEAGGSIRFTVGRDCINRIAVDGEEYVEVPVVRLDDVIEGSPALIKVDVEGYEGSVIAGGMRTFANTSAVIMELNGQTGRFGRSESDIRQTLADLGFREVSYDPESRSLIAPTRRGNSIFVRDGVEERVGKSRRYRVRDQFV